MTARRFTCLWLPVLCLSSTIPLPAQENAGALQFSRDCAGCHGADGRGGEKAPAIATIPTVITLSDEQIIKIVHDGTPGGMPAFPQLSDASIRGVVGYLRTLQGKTSASASLAITGNVDNGLALYFGKAQCSNCHMINGQGGFIASDLNAYGETHSANAIIKAIVTPDVPLLATSRVVEVRTKSGEQLSGIVRFEDNFSLELQTQDGRYHFLNRSSFADEKYTDHSLMPRDYATRLTRTELNDIASYLITAGRSAPQGPPPQAPKTAQAGSLGIVDVQPGELLTPARDNWLSYNGDHSGSRFSTLSEVTPANANRLQVKWVFHSHDSGALEVTPVVASGVMFVTSQNDAYALDATTGNLLWHHIWPITQGLIDDAAIHHNRGVAVLGTRLYMETDNAHLLCLDARTGSLIFDVPYATGNKNYGATSAPLIAANKVLVSTSGGDDGVRGFLAAFDPQTGKEVWRFWSIPGPGEFGNESWPNGLWEHGGGAMWMPGTYDPELNLLYWGTGNPTPDYDGAVRPGDDLYTCAVVALDPDTGKLKWYFQYSPHNLYDYDSLQTPVLINAAWKGQPRKLLVSANRNGFLYILDRTNGQFLYGWSFISDLNWAKGLDENGRPISNDLVPDEKGVLVCPSVDGATNWYSPTYNPNTNMFYFRSQEACTILTRTPEEFKEGRTYYAGGGKQPPAKTMKGFINAFSLGKMDFDWRNPQVGDSYTWAGVMSTAGGLVAYANQQDFILLDAHSGKSLWHFNLGQVPHASPMSYGVNGHQYFSIAAGSDLFVFGLP